MADKEKTTEIVKDTTSEEKTTKIAKDKTEEERKEIEEKIKTLVPMDDILFIKLAGHNDFCCEMLRVFLNDPNIEVCSNKPQVKLVNFQGRSVILDLECKLSDGSIVAVEVQKANNDDHQRRVRYNSSLLTINRTETGIDFKDIPNIISIFISSFDVFKLGCTIYKVKHFAECKGKLIALDNGLQEIYVNSAYCDEDDSTVSKLMRVFSEKNYNDHELFPRTTELKRQYTQTEEGIVCMRDIIAELLEGSREKIFQEGKQEGKQESLIEVAKNMLKDKETVERISRITKLPYEQIEKLCISD